MASDDARPAVVGLGEVLWDDLPGGRRLGGAPANVAYHAGLRGCRAEVVSAVGDDDLGREALDVLKQRGVGAAGVAVLPDRPTGVVDVDLDDSGSASYTIREGVAWDAIPATDNAQSLAGGAAAIVFGSLAQRADASRKTIRRLLDAAGAGCLKVFDVNLRPPHFSAEIVRGSLERADVFKLNHDEIGPCAQMLGLPAGEAAFVKAALAAFDLRLVAVTRGGEGSLLATPGDWHEQPPAKVEVVDTVGAGDSFTAAVVAGLLRDEPIETIHRRAAAVAAYVCTQNGATPDVPAEVLNDK